MGQKIEYEVVAKTKAAEDQVNKLNDAVKKVEQSSKRTSKELSAGMQIGNEGVKALDKSTGGLASKLVAVGKAATLSGKAMKTALISTGIGAAVVALGLIVEYWDDIVDLVTGANKKLQEQIDLHKKYASEIKIQLGFNEQIRKSLELQGKSVQGIIDKRIKLLTQLQTELIGENALLQTQYLKEQSKAKELTIMERINALAQEDGSFEGIVTDEELARLKEISDQINANQKAIIDYQNTKLQLELESDEIKKPKGKVKDDTDVDPEVALKAKAIEEITKLESDYFDSQLDKKILEENAVRDKYTTLISEANKYKQDTTVLEEARQAELTAITLKYETEAAEKLKAAKEKIAQGLAITEDEKRALEIQKIMAHYAKLIELARANGLLTAELEKELTDAQQVAVEEVTAKGQETQQQAQDAWMKQYQEKIAKVGEWLEVVSGGLNAIAQMQSIRHKQENRDGDQSEKAKEQRARRQFKAQKKMNVAMAVVNAAQGIVSSLAQAPVAIGPIPSPVGIASLAVAAASGIASIAAIAATKFDGGGAPPPAPNVGAVEAAPPAFNIVGQSDTNQLADAIGGQEQVPVQAYVVAGAVSTAQELERNIIEDASIGG